MTALAATDTQIVVLPENIVSQLQNLSLQDKQRHKHQKWWSYTHACWINCNILKVHARNSESIGKGKYGEFISYRIRVK